MRRRRRVRPRVLWGGGEPPPSVTFPTTPLVSRAQIALGADLSADPLTWQWADITNKVRFDLGVSLTVGRRDESSTVAAGRGTLKLDNRDGRFTRRNPASPYYGLLSKNTPIWVTVDAGSGEKTRMEMFVNEWPKAWADKSANDSTVTIQCAGVLRRLAQGRVLKSAARRAVLAANPLVYWPLEDGSGATVGASALPSGTPMTVLSGTVTWAGSNPPAGSAAAPDLTADGRLFAPAPTSTTLAYTIEFLAKCALAPADIPIALRMTGGLYSHFWVYTQIDGVTGGQFAGGNPGSLVDNFGNFPVLTDYDNQWHHYRIIVKETAGSVSASFWVDGVAGSGLPTAMTLGQISGVEVNSNIFNTSIAGSLIHVAVYDYEMTEDHSDALLAYAGEMAHVRIRRLCGEEGIVFETTAATSAAMGPQGVNTLTALLRECETADGGALYEKRWGLAYKSLNEYYNQPVGLPLDIGQYQLAELPDVADDDQRTRNLWVVSRTNGSEYTAEEDSGEMGTGAQGPGVYDDAVTLNVIDDDQLPQQASWRVHLGTVDEDRWPDVGLNFARQPGLIDTWAALGYGVRITIANPVSQMPPDPPDLIIEGHSERWNSKQWTASLNCSPASVYDVYQVETGSDNHSRIPAGASVTAAAYDDNDTSLSVTSTTVRWIDTATYPTQFPIAIVIAGERMTCTDITGTGLTQTFTVTRSVNGVIKSLPAGSQVQIWRPPVVAL